MSDHWPDFNDLWNYGDPAGTEATFREILPQIEASGNASYHLQLLTQIARALGLQDRFDEAHALLDEVEAKMERPGIVAVRYLLERGRLFNSSGQPAQAVPLFEQAVEAGKQAAADFYTVDALHMLAIAAPPGERLGWNLKAMEYAEESGQPTAKKWIGSLYNNIGWALFDQQRYEQALEMFEKARDFRAAQQNPDALRVARWCIAKTLRVMGRAAEALAIQRELEADPKHTGFVEEEIAECLHTLGEIEEAKPYFRQAHQALSQINWVAADTARIERLCTLGQ